MYRSLPTPLQDLAITVANQAVLWKKFGKFAIIRKEPPQLECLSEFEAALRFQSFLQKAREVPALKNLPSLSGGSLDQQLKSLPLQSKADFKTRASSFRHPASRMWNSLSFKTSGTTGSPLQGTIARRDLRHRFLNLLAWYHELGLDLRMSWARFGGLDLLNPNAHFRPDRQDLLRGHYFFSVYHISERTAPTYYEALSKSKIQVLEGYPSAIASLAKLLVKAGYKRLPMRAVILTAETLSAEQSYMIEQAFGVTPLQYYGSSEMSPLLVSRSDDTLELVGGTGLVELLDSNDSPVRTPGETGRMVVTSFDSSFMPLLRYDIGDLAEYVRGGVHNLCVRRIVGRVEDILPGASGQHVGRLSTALKHLPDRVVEAQICVHGGNVCLKYVAPDILTQEDLHPFHRHMRDKVGDLQLSSERVEKIPNGPHGKRSAVVVARDRLES
jgi:phenylacetate-CoA ligase